MPASNHTYLLREVGGLRQCGLDPLVASIRPPDRAPDALTPEERDEASRTFYVQS